MRDYMWAGRPDRDGHRFSVVYDFDNGASIGMAILLPDGTSLATLKRKGVDRAADEAELRKRLKEWARQRASAPNDMAVSPLE